MRVLVIGFGSMGKRHAANARALGHEVGVQDVDTERCCRQAVSDGYIVPDEDWLPGVEAVVIATPVATHAEVAGWLRAVPHYAGPLFVEKPLATSVANAAVFSHWPHQTTMVGYNLRWQKQAMELVTAIAPATFVECRLECDMKTWPGTQYGDFLIECSHEIDLALACGVPPTVSAATIVPPRARIWLGSAGLIRIDAGASEYRREWSGLGATAGYQWRFDSPSELGEQMYRDELAHFLACAERGVATECPFDDGLAVLRIFEQAKTMAATSIA